MHPLLSIIQRAPDAQAQLLNSINNEDFSCQAISFVNPYSYQLLRKHADNYHTIDCLYSDGMLSSIMFSKCFGRTIPRLSFDYGSFAKVFFETAQANKLPIYIIGSKQEQLDGAIKQFKLTFPELNICGSHNGYFDNFDIVVEKIKQSGAQYVICGLGTPKQDVFAQYLKKQLPKQLKQIYTCGGFLHQSEQGIQYYPNWVNNYNVRWLYRAINEPQVIKRLVLKYPLFAFYLIKDRFFYAPQKS